MREANVIRSLSTAVAVITLLATGCAMAPKAGAPSQAEPAPPAATSRTPQTSSSGSR